jgi:hypothetical protein
MHTYWAQMESYREAELKHGRIAMIATAGWMVQPWFHPVGPVIGVTDVTDPIKTLYETPLPGLLQILVFTGFIEFLSLKIKKNPTYSAGDLLGSSELVDNTDKGWLDFQQRELSNGRLAMTAIMGFWIQDLLYGNSGDMLFKPLL